MGNNCPHPYITQLCKALPNSILHMPSGAFWMNQNLHKTLWVKNTFVMFIQIAQETGIFIFMVDWYLYNGCQV